VLIRDGAPEGNPWGIKFLRMIDMANDSHLFRTRAQLEAGGWRLAGNAFHRDAAAGFGRREEVWLPLYEAKMMHHFDHRWATYEGAATREVTLSEKRDPDFLARPRYWVDGEEVQKRVPKRPERLAAALAAPENYRRQAVMETFAYWAAGFWRKLGQEEKAETLLAAALPLYISDSQDDVFTKWSLGSECERMQERFPLTEADVNRMALAILSDPLPLAEELLERFSPKWLLGWRDIARSTDERTVIAGALPWAGVGHTLPLKIIDESKKAYIAPLLSNLTSLSFDYVARQCLGGTHLTFFIYKQLPVLPPSTYDRPCPWSTEISLKDWLASRVLELAYTARDLAPFALDLGYDGPPFQWDEDRRFLIRGELDAAFFHLYGLSREEADYILDTFPIVKRKDEQRYGDYRTQRVILEIYDDLQRAMSTGAPYRTRLDPPPGDPRAAHKI
jgi:hypothetical protein